MSTTFSHQRRRSDRRDWPDGCSARTGLLICAFFAVAAMAGLYWGLS